MDPKDRDIHFIELKFCSHAKPEQTKVTAQNQHKSTFQIKLAGVGTDCGSLPVLALTVDFLLVLPVACSMTAEAFVLMYPPTGRHD
eukprot:1160252-Pelagomonas_calceolata.AAC.23